MELRPVAVEMGGCGAKSSSSGDGRGCGAKTSSSGGRRVGPVAVKAGG